MPTTKAPRPSQPSRWVRILRWVSLILMGLAANKLARFYFNIGDYLSCFKESDCRRLSHLLFDGDLQGNSCSLQFLRFHVAVSCLPKWASPQLQTFIVAVFTYFGSATVILRGFEKLDLGLFALLSAFGFVSTMCIGAVRDDNTEEIFGILLLNVFLAMSVAQYLNLSGYDKSPRNLNQKCTGEGKKEELEPLLPLHETGKDQGELEKQ